MSRSKVKSVRHAESGQVLIKKSRWCDTHLSRMRGFTFKRKLSEGEGLVLVDKKDNRVNAAITMLFVFFDLGVIWVDSAGTVVDKQLARSWRLQYTPKQAAQYVIESDPSILQKIEIGDSIEFAELDAEPKN